MQTLRLAVAGLSLVMLGGAAAAPDVPLTIDNFSFSKATLEIVAGTRVVWTNRDDIPHTVTSAEDPGATHSPALDTGDSYSRTFDKPGTYRYFCSLHPNMQGIVTVRAKPGA